MNKVTYLTSEYIIDKRIKDINLTEIIYSNYEKIKKYISDDLIYSFAFNINIFKKLVLYNYCYDYLIEDLTDDELDRVNNYINNKYSILHSIEPNMKTFLDWCKQYNKNNSKKINIVSKRSSKISFR